MVSPASVDLSQVSVLCVDDDPVIRTIVRGALLRHRCQDIVQARNGQEALDLCSGRSFSLIICDLHMEPMNGLAFVRELGERGIAGGRPLIMLSGDTDPAAIAAAEDLGVSTWLSKPISAQRLIDRVAAALGLGAGAACADEPSLASQSDRHHTRLMTRIDGVEALLGSLPYRERDRTDVWAAMQRALSTMAGEGGLYGYALVTELAQRGADLLLAAAANPLAAAEHHAAVSQAMGSIATAIRRVLQMRLAGDGAKAGLQLLLRLDAMLGPLRGVLDRPAA